MQIIKIKISIACLFAYGNNLEKNEKLMIQEKEEMIAGTLFLNR